MTTSSQSSAPPPPPPPPPLSSGTTSAAALDGTTTTTTATLNRRCAQTQRNHRRRVNPLKKTNIGGGPRPVPRPSPPSIIIIATVAPGMDVKNLASPKFACVKVAACLTACLMNYQTAIAIMINKATYELLTFSTARCPRIVFRSDKILFCPLFFVG